MASKSWKVEREELAEKIRRSLNLEDDMIIDEVLTSESKQDAISRIQNIERDAQIALRVLTIKSFPFPSKRREATKTCPHCEAEYIGTPQMHKFDCSSQR